tara:strand:- start:227 stop:724 length:498 start_codon:yes stop_codon:yes gene_type:complete
MYAVRALVGTRTLGLPCESAKSDLDKAIGLGGGSDTLTVAAGVYSSCDDQKQAIGVSKRALALTPNDADWFITSNLISYLHLDNNKDEIRLIMKNKGDAKDWPSHILMYFSYLNAIDDNFKSAKSYFDRALERGADVKRLKRTFRITADDHEIIRELVKLGLKLE